MKKITFACLIMAALCFVACGNNQSKKAQAAAQTAECAELCCDDAATKACAGASVQSCCAGEATAHAACGAATQSCCEGEASSLATAHACSGSGACGGGGACAHQVAANTECGGDCCGSVAVPTN